MTENNNLDRSVNRGNDSDADMIIDYATYFDIDSGSGYATGNSAGSDYAGGIAGSGTAGGGGIAGGGSYAEDNDGGFATGNSAGSGTAGGGSAGSGIAGGGSYAGDNDIGFATGNSAGSGTAGGGGRQYLPGGLDALPTITLEEALRDRRRASGDPGQQAGGNTPTIQDLYASFNPAPARRGAKRPAVQKYSVANADPAKRLGIGTLLFFVIMTACVLAPFSLNSFTRSSTEQLQSDSWMEAYNNGVYNLMSEALGDVYFMKKQLVIPENAISGSVPDEAGYRVNDDGSIDEAIGKALMYGLMQSNETVFTSDTDLWKDEPAVYYLDESVFSILWKEKINGSIVNFAEIFISDPSQFRRKLTGNQYGSSLRETTSKLSQSANAVVGMSGDFYAWRKKGITVYQRKVCRCKLFAGIDVCYVKSNGDLILRHYASKTEVSDVEVQDFVDKNDIVFSLSFGPNLIIDGVPQKLNLRYDLGEPGDRYSRASISQIGNLHYLLCTIDGGVNREEGTDIVNLQKILNNKGAYQAYTLDGGQTATIFFNGNIFNRVGYGSERNISDIIYFASAAGSAESA